MHFLILTNILALLVCSVDSARILGIWHIPAFSHQQLGNKLLHELAARGHEVTMISPFVPKQTIKNFKTIQISFPDFGGGGKNMFDEADTNIISRVIFLDMMGLTITETTLNQTGIQGLLKSDEQFDLVIMENFLNEAFKGFCHHFKAPCLMVSTVGSSRWTNLQVGNPASPSYVPDMYLSLSSNMNFCERLYNSALYVGATLFSHLYTFPKQNELLHKFFPDAPPLDELYYNTSLMLLNSHVSTNAPVPYVPSMIDIGGYHVNEPKKLPKDLQEYLDNAKDGAIFFSMGSNLKSKDMDKNKRDAILKVFSKLKQKVLWKWEDETLPGQPPNVKLDKWLPQQDILAHPNIKLFITHGGLLSTIETIYHGVPIVGIPIYGDQEMNVANAEIAGFGLAVPYKQLNEQTFGEALNKILNDPKYAENAKTRSKIMHDQPIKPLEKAMFWVEYVLRHRGAPHLRTAALSLAWYQYLLLDVVAFVAVVILVSLYILCKVLKRICGRNNKTRVSQAKKKN